MRTILLLLVSVFLFLGCYSTKRVVKTSDKLIQDVYGKRGKVYSIYKNRDKKFYILQNGKIVHNNLKFVKVLYSDGKKYNLQVIDSKNSKKLLTIKSKIEPHHRFICGSAYLNAFHFWFKSKKDSILIETVRGGVEDTREKESVSLKNIDEVLFVNMKKAYDFGEFSFNKKKIFTSPYTLIYKKGKKYGILGKLKREKKGYILDKFDKTVLYDNIYNLDDILVLKQNRLLGFYKTTDIKYKSLEPFDRYLARFELPNGRKGYVDIKGKEYYD